MLHFPLRKAEKALNSTEEGVTEPNLDKVGKVCRVFRSHPLLALTLTPLRRQATVL